MPPKKSVVPPRIIDLVGEVWRPLKDYPGYDISNMGRVRSHKRVKQFGYPTLVKPTKSYAYLRVCLPVVIDGKRCFRLKSVHSLVLITFVRPRREGEHACHNNGDGNDNRLSNLRWDTPKNNCADKRKHGTVILGERHHNTTLTADEVRALWKEAHTTGKTNVLIAEEFGVSKHVVGDILRGKTWGHITKNLPTDYSEEAEE